MSAHHAVPSALRRDPFTVRAALAHGLSRHAVRGQRFRRLFHGVYVCADVEPTVQVRARGARLLLPADAVFSHHTAAALRDIPVPDDGRVHATVAAAGDRRRARGLMTHVGSVTTEVTSDRGLPVTSGPRTFVDLGTRLDLVDLVVVGDTLVRHGLATTEDLAAAARRRPGGPQRRTARAAQLVRPRVDSAMETRARLLLVFAGLPEPVTGTDVYAEDGSWLARVDLQYPEERIVIEYDGDLHRTSRRKWRNEIRARDLLLRAGWQVIVLTADDIYRAVAPDSAAHPRRAGRPRSPAGAGQVGSPAADRAAVAASRMNVGGREAPTWTADVGRRRIAHGSRRLAARSAGYPVTGPAGRGARCRNLRASRLGTRSTDSSLV